MSKNENSSKLNRRDFFKIGGITAAVGAGALTTLPQKTAAKELDKRLVDKIVTTHDDFPVEVRPDYVPPRNWDHVQARSFFVNEIRAIGETVEDDIVADGQAFVQKMNFAYDNDKIGYNQADKALLAGAWAMNNYAAGPSPAAVPNFGVNSWEQRAEKVQFALFDNDYVVKEKYKFESKQEAANQIKRAAKLFGADLVGITRRDKRWDYSKFLNPVPPLFRKPLLAPPSKEQLEELHNWGPDKFVTDWSDFPFEPKTVIVLAFNMDYEGISTSPSFVGSAAAGAGYSEMAKVPYQLAVYLKNLGFNAVSAGNDMGLSVPYAIAAGLGEASRLGQAVTYKYGPRVRLAKVYTDFDFVEYDKPKSFGVMDFCKNCMRCADACPTKAISFDKEPSFEPTHDNKDNAWYNVKGVKKYHVDAKKCFKLWGELGDDCGICMASCPYNKPDFWHHRLVDSITAAMPGPVHDLMREMDILFGYGNVEDKESIKKFYSPEGKSYDGH
ncbi:reductive dehalogenase [Marinifilum fragile]|uniref:reductive dehalogenase n=1 Tax=Marinifilum fragile TaxID=570161 RepID=UPI002AA76EE8|nr:reductive dehalogenase [Marinifilum fragile]